MHPPGHYATMTDEQLAEWHQLVTRNDRLNALLLAEQNKVMFLNAQLANEHEKYAGMEDEFRADFARVDGERTYYADAHHKAYNQLRALAEAAVPFFVAWITAHAHLADEALSKDARDMRQTAREMMILVSQLLP